MAHLHLTLVKIKVSKEAEKIGNTFLVGDLGSWDVCASLNFTFHISGAVFIEDEGSTSELYLLELEFNNYHLFIDPGQVISLVHSL